MRKPLICPIAYPDESPCSLLLRASESNGWKSPDAFISAYGVHSSKKTYSLHSLITNKNHWQKVCKVLGIINRVKCYEKMKVSRGSNYNFLGNFVKYKSLKLKEPSICPDCIHEKKYISSMFDHRLITVCSTHHIKLLSECPACKEKLKWSRRGLLTCSCGHQLDSFKSISADTTDIEEVIQNKDVSTLDLIFKFFEAFEVFFKNINIATDQHQLVELAGKSLLEKQKVINLLSKHVKKTARLYGLHPRLILSPFLSSSEQEINKLASSTLMRLVKSKITLGKTLNSIDFHVNKVSARKVLGISSFLTEELINNSLLEVKQQGKHRVQNITISSINELLILFNSTTKSNKPKTSYKALGHYSGKNASHRISLVNLIQKIKSNEVKVVGVNFSSGILSAKVYIKPIKVKKYDYITMTDVAKICGVHQESIRFAVWSGVLKRIDSQETKGTTIYIEKRVAIRFNEKYIFAGKLAKENNCSRSSLAMKLIASGIKPVSGPGVDKGLTYLFKRSDISSIDMNKVIKMKNYSTNTGRKKKSLRTEETNKQEIPLFAVAYQLDISIPKASSLIKRGFLIEANTTSRKVMVTIESFNFVKGIQQDTSLVTLQQASISVNKNQKTFIRHWINSKFITLVENGIDRYISKKDLTMVKEYKKKYITSKEAGIITNTHRTHMLNLEKQKLIKPAKQLISGNHKINLYKREQVLEICK